jgi:hypothetical protein
VSRQGHPSTARLHTNNYYGTVLFFFVHHFHNQRWMLGYVQSHKTYGHVDNWQNLRRGKVVEWQSDGRKEVVCITMTEEGIAMVRSGGKRFFVTQSTRRES